MDCYKITTFCARFTQNKNKKQKKINYNDIFDEYLAFVVVLFVDRHLDFWVEFKIRGRSLCPFMRAFVFNSV